MHQKIVKITYFILIVIQLNNYHNVNIYYSGTGTSYILRENQIDAKSKILSGELISIEEAPYQVYLTFITQVSCGGALIEPDIVLTAAHCVEDVVKENYEMFVVAGTNNANLSSEIVDGRVRISPRRIEIHSKYDQNSLVLSLKYDLAIIQVKFTHFYYL